MREPAQVVEGRRGVIPLSELQQDTAPKPIGRRELIGVCGHPLTLLQAKGRGYMITLKATQDRFDISTGELVRGVTENLVFKDGVATVCETCHPEHMPRLMRIPGYGVGRDFWLAEDLAKNVKEKVYEGLLSQVKTDPDLLRRLTLDVNRKEFDIEPPRPEAEGKL